MAKRYQYAPQKTYLSTTDTPIVLYKFDGSADSLNDRTGNGFTLSHDTTTDGLVAYCDQDNLRGLYFNGKTRFRAAGTSGAFSLRQTGDCTISVIFSAGESLEQDRFVGGDVGYLALASGDINSSSEGSNRCWGVAVTDETLYGRYQWIHESGAGTLHYSYSAGSDGSGFTGSAPSPGYGFLPGKMQLLTAVRSSNRIQYYVDGIAAGGQGPTYTASASIGGTPVQYLYVGGAYASSNGSGTDKYRLCFIGGIFSLAVWGSALTAAQIEAEARRAGFWRPTT